ncbi:S8 family peptidase [Kribbella sp. NPDC051587]|uniref:S8 family peptidase n=1 Tax=Kribbella sp. NPDC051587 TaxID=3364119 RepID=UPI0037B6B010
MQPKRWIVPLVGLGLTIGTPAFAGPAARPAAPQPPPTPTSITLITGDRIQVTQSAGKPAKVAFIPGPGSRSDAAATTYSAGHTYVVPSAAAAEVASGKLDRSLFDVTTLIAEQRDDAHSATMPVIVHYAGSAATAKTRAKQSAITGAAGSRALTSIGARAAAVTKTKAGSFWASVHNSTISRVTLDRRVQVKLDQSVPQIGAPAAWQRGLTGKGSKIAILDSGIDPTHPDFAGRIAANQNFSAAEDAVDHAGHGTHVASIAAGDGAASGGKYKGVAPEATLLNGKVLDDSGGGDYSSIIAGMEWAATQGADVANLSLGSYDPSDGTDDLSLAVNRISAETGLLFVVAAGNCFPPGAATVTAPAAADDALAVGNLQRDGSVSPTSCHGPRKGDGALKPEISAPGTDIVAARAAGTDMGEPVDDHYTTLSGTSMATPHVAGTAALLAQAHPDWTFRQLRERLISTADPQPGSGLDEQGAGRVDADQATDNSVTVDAGELELGVLRWPYPASDPVSKVLTYHNPTSAPVVLKLAADVKLSASQVTVPANGDASVTVTVDRAAGGPGHFDGRITATAEGADPIVTTYGWMAETELYNLTIKGITKTGATANGDVALSRLDGNPVPGAFMTNGTLTLRVAPGKYEAAAFFATAATDAAPVQEYDFAVTPEVNVTKDMTVTLDGRGGQTVQFAAAGQPGLTSRDRSIGYVRKNAAGEFVAGTGYSFTGAPRLVTAAPSAKVTTGTSEFSAGSRLEVPPYRITAGTEEFDVLDFYFGPRFTGVKDLQVASGPADYRGKLAVIAAPDDLWSGDLIKAAQDAGAAAAVLYNPDVAGNNGVFSYWAAADGIGGTIPSMRTSRTNAQRLLAFKGTVRVTGQAATPFVYDLMVPWPNQVPAKPSLTVTPKQLARVDETFRAQVDGMPTSESRHGVTPFGTELGGFLAPTFATPARRTSYILGGDQIRWSTTVVANNGGGQETAMSGNGSRLFRAGERTTADWMTSVQNSGLSTRQSDLYGVRRTADGLYLGLSTFRHGPDEESDSNATNDNVVLALERNGTEVGTNQGPYLVADVPADKASYKATLDVGRSTDFWKYSTNVHSEWTFHSAGGADEVMPLVLADLDVPALDLLNRVPSGKPTELCLGLRHQVGAATAKFTDVRLESSVDGTHWTRLPLTPTSDGHYKTTLTVKQSPSLRITATDAKGNSLKQQITAAYGVK